MMHLDLWSILLWLKRCSLVYIELVKEKSVTSHHPSHNSTMQLLSVGTIDGTRIPVLVLGLWLYNCNGEEGIMVPYL